MPLSLSSSFDGIASTDLESAPIFSLIGLKAFVTEAPTSSPNFCVDSFIFATAPARESLTVLMEEVISVETFWTESTTSWFSFEVMAESSSPTIETTPAKPSFTEDAITDKFFSTDSKRRSSSFLSSSITPSALSSFCMSSVKVSRCAMNSSRLELSTVRLALKIKAANKPQRLVPKMPFIFWKST